MKKTPKPSPEFDTFTGFMDKLAKVPHGELKAKLDAEKAEKQANDWVKRGSQKHVRTGGNQGAVFSRSAEDSAPLQTLAENLNREARRKIN
jgi:hypothetical protein